MLKKLRLLVLLPLLAACSGSPTSTGNTEIIGEPVDPTHQWVRVFSSVTSQSLPGATVIGRNQAVTDTYGMAVVFVDPQGETNIKVSAPGFRGTERLLRGRSTVDGMRFYLESLP